MEVRRFRKLLEQTRVDFPFQMTFYLNPTTSDMFIVGAICEVVERDTKEPVKVNFHMNVPFVWARQYLRTPNDRLKELRGFIHRVVCHEVDECLKVKQRRIFDPHKRARLNGSIEDDQFR